jgi:hypothetical protein
VPTCEICGNDYDKTFEVIVGNERHVVDSFQCAIQALAPQCPHQVTRTAQASSDIFSKSSFVDKVRLRPEG